MRLLTKNLNLLVAVCAAAAALFSWLAAPAPAQPKATSTEKEEWTLPETPQHDSAKDIATLTARNLWGVTSGANADVPKAPEWKISGIARAGDERFILLAYEGKPAEMLKVGDVLPDGGKIVTIENDRFIILTADKKKLPFGIYQHEQAK